jgi:hypothetical protein
MSRSVRAARTPAHATRQARTLKSILAPERGNAQLVRKRWRI